MVICSDVVKMLDKVNHLIFNDLLAHGYTHYGLGERLNSSYGWKNSGVEWESNGLRGFSFSLKLDDTYGLELRDTITLTTAKIDFGFLPDQLDNLVECAYQSLIHVKDMINLMCSEAASEPL